MSDALFLANMASIPATEERLRREIWDDNQIPTKPRRDRSREPATRQEEAILARLEISPATGLELQKWARCLNHTSRVSHLRQLGYDIRCQRERREDGVTVGVYTLYREVA